MRQFQSHERHLLAMASLVYVASVVALSELSDESPGLVVASTFPLLLYCALLVFHSDPGFATHWIAPPALSAAFYLLWRWGALPFLAGLEGGSLAAVNLLIAYILNVFLLVLWRLEAAPTPSVQLRRTAKALAAEHRAQQEEIRELSRTVTQLRKTLVVTEQNFRVTLRSIEDKCKAINFVIGRVYGNRKGGAASLRDKLRIPREIYNAFSAVTADFQEQDAARLLAVLHDLSTHLTILEQPEHRILSPSDFRAGIKRNPVKVPILDILARDRDPVKEYHAEAKEICEKLRAYLAGRAKSEKVEALIATST